MFSLCYFIFFFFNDTATTEIYTLSLHDALPICLYGDLSEEIREHLEEKIDELVAGGMPRDRKSTRLNSSHGYISYAVFCLKKKKKKKRPSRSGQNPTPCHCTRTTHTPSPLRTRF